jgi:hypothetical protein
LLGLQLLKWPTFFRTPSLDSIDRTVRNISGATITQIGELDELSLRLEELRVSGLFPAPHARRSPSISEMSRTSSSLKASAAAEPGEAVQARDAAKAAGDALRSEQTRGLLKKTFLAKRREPLFTQTATQSLEQKGKWADNSSDLRQAFAQGPIVANKLPLPRRSSAQPQNGTSTPRKGLPAPQDKVPEFAPLIRPAPTGLVAPTSLVFGSPSANFGGNGPSESSPYSSPSSRGGALRSNEKKRASSAVRLPPRDGSSPSPSSKPSSGFSFGALPPPPAPRTTVAGFRSFEGLQAPVPLFRQQGSAPEVQEITGEEEEEEEGEDEYDEEEYDESFGDEGDEDGFEDLTPIKEEADE